MRKNDVFDKERFRHIQIREYRRMKVPELFIQILFNPIFTEERRKSILLRQWLRAIGQPSAKRED